VSDTVAFAILLGLLMTDGALRREARRRAAGRAGLVLGVGALLALAAVVGVAVP
jgi:hypothetical protein